MTTATLIEKVRAEVGPLDARGEQIVAASLKVLQDSNGDAVFSHEETSFRCCNITLEEYIALARPERRRYLSDAESLNRRWIEKHVKQLAADWIMVVDGKVVLHGESIKTYPEYDEFIALCKKLGKYPFVFFAPHVLAVEESVTSWHRTSQLYDAYPTVPIAVQGNSSRFEVIADLDTGALNNFCSLEFLLGIGFIELLPGEVEHTGQHLSRSYSYFTRHAWLIITDEDGVSNRSRTPIFCVDAWEQSPFTSINPNRTFLIGRRILLEIQPRLTLDFAARQTEVQFPTAAS